MAVHPRRLAISSINRPKDLRCSLAKNPDDKEVRFSLFPVPMLVRQFGPRRGPTRRCTELFRASSRNPGGFEPAIIILTSLHLYIKDCTVCRSIRTEQSNGASETLAQCKPENPRPHPLDRTLQVRLTVSTGAEGLDRMFQRDISRKCLLTKIRECAMSMNGSSLNGLPSRSDRSFRSTHRRPPRRMTESLKRGPSRSFPRSEIVFQTSASRIPWSRRYRCRQGGRD